MNAIEEVSEAQQAVEKAEAEVVKNPNGAAPTINLPPLPADPEECTPDFAAACPDGWTDNGSVCRPHEGYSGACKQIESGLPDIAKAAAASYCQAKWGCNLECEQDYSFPCPSSWTEVHAGLCVAPSDAILICEAQLDVVNLSADDKRRVGVECNLQWPCKRSGSVCQQNFAAKCPAGWIETGAGCAPPPTYTGECGFEQLAKLTRGQKEAWAASCGASFPCL